MKSEKVQKFIKRKDKNVLKKKSRGGTKSKKKRNNKTVNNKMNKYLHRVFGGGLLLVFERYPHLHEFPKPWQDLRL